LGAFASDISQLPRIVTLNNISISPNTKTKGGLIMDTTAKTFRYLDEEETVKQKGGSK
ncbi:MAG: type 4a pilus biogenesis protein PilO, partial [Proteobacteria bacterium]|nr:type 4a pilus biogenesis protein PilO [Pseudomonadota bacterium]